MNIIFFKLLIIQKEIFTLKIKSPKLWVRKEKIIDCILHVITSMPHNFLLSGTKGYFQMKKNLRLFLILFSLNPKLHKEVYIPFLPPMYSVVIVFYSTHRYRIKQHNCDCRKISWNLPVCVWSNRKRKKLH